MKIFVGCPMQAGGQPQFAINALKKLGHDVRVFDYNQHYKLYLWNRALNKFLRAPHYFLAGRLNKNLIAEAKSFIPDFILFFKPIFVYPKTVKTLTRLSKVFSWYPDYVLFPKTASSFFYKSIPFFDYHFSFNYENSLEILKYGAKKSIFLPCAADPECHHPVSVSEEEKKQLGADIVFVGTYAKEKRSEYMEKLCEDGYDVKVYGNNWEKYPKEGCLYKRGCIQFKEFTCEGMSKVFNSAKIVLAFVREHNKETLACRSYEIPACVAFMLHQRTEKIGEVLKEGREAEFFSSYEEMKNKIDFYLKHDDLRGEIARRGEEKIRIGGHLFVDRMKLILDIFKALR